MESHSWFDYPRDLQGVVLGPFYFLGGDPGKPLPAISEAKIARHTKGNQDGYKAERPNIRTLNKGEFMKYETIRDIYQVLFGSST